MIPKHRILCIDDDSDDVDMLKQAFHSLNMGYEFIQARDGEEGIRRLHKMIDEGDSPCLVVLDINMPRMDGRETFMAIKKDPRLTEIPVVIFSTSSSAMDKLFFSKKNVEYFVKPIDFKKLTTVAQTFLSMCEGNWKMGK